jgi:predicted nucleotidyltransferase
MVTMIETSESLLLFGKTRRAILSLLFTHADESFYLRRIVRLTGLGIGPVQRELKQLVNAGIITREKSGNQVYFQANSRSPIFLELRAIIVKTSGLSDVLKSALSELAEKITLAFVYGSLAKGTEDRRSDIDILVIGDVSLLEVVSALKSAQDTLMREINVITYSKVEFKNRLRQKEHFIYAVWNDEKIILFGDSDEFDRLG